MGEVPRSLTELKIQIGKDIHLHGLGITYRTTDACREDLDQVLDQFYAEIADRWRAKYPDIAEKFGQAAEKALLELPWAQGGAVVTLLVEMLKYTTSMVMTGSSTKAFYSFSVLNGILDADNTNAQQYFEALVAYSRGE